MYLKCPQSRQGKFLEVNSYKFSNMNKVTVKHPKFGLKHSIEPTFYTGSRYVSYGTEIAITTYVLTLIFGLDFGSLGHLLSIVEALLFTIS